MDTETLGLLITSGLSSAALIVTAVEGKRQRQVLRLQMVNESVDRFSAFQDRFYDLLGAPADGVTPPEWRKLLIGYFSFYARLFLSHRVGVFPKEQWEDLRVSLAYWARREEVRRAWAEFAREADAWPAGFVDFVDAELAAVGPDAEKLWAHHDSNPRAWERLREDLAP